MRPREAARGVDGGGDSDIERDGEESGRNGEAIGTSGEYGEGIGEGTRGPKIS